MPTAYFWPPTVRWAYKVPHEYALCRDSIRCTLISLPTVAGAVHQLHGKIPFYWFPFMTVIFLSMFRIIKHFIHSCVEFAANLYHLIDYPYELDIIWCTFMSDTVFICLANLKLVHVYLDSKTCSPFSIGDTKRFIDKGLRPMRHRLVD